MYLFRFRSLSMTFRLARACALLLVLPLACTTVAGCGPAAAKQGPQPPSKVEFARAVSCQITDYEEFTGKTDAEKTVEVRTRVTGYLEKINFKDGDDVHKGDILFEIDPRPFQAILASADAGVTQSRAHLERLRLDLDRARSLLPRRAISQEEFDKLAGDSREAEASVGVAKAARQAAQLNLGFTRITSLIDGRISRHFVDVGNDVKADDTLLTTIVSLEPIYAYFDIDERTMLRLRRLVPGGNIKPNQATNLPVLMGLADEDTFPRKGTITFVDNRVDPGTGTLRLRGTFSNPDHFLAPGMFVRIRVPIGGARQVTLVPERALGSDQGRKFVFVVKDATQGHEVVRREVKIGTPQGDLRVIEEGVKPGDRVVVSGLQRIRLQRRDAESEPSMAVTAEESDKATR